MLDYDFLLAHFLNKINLTKLKNYIDSPTHSAYFLQSLSSQSTEFPQPESQNVCPFGADTPIGY